MDKKTLAIFLNSGAILSLNPKALLIGYGPCQWHMHPGSKPAFYFPDFFLKTSKPWLQFENWREISYEELFNAFEDLEQPSYSKWENPYLDLFEKTFQQLQNEFAQNKLQKAVPYTFSCSHALMSKDRLSFTLKNAMHYPNNYPVYLYGFWYEEEGLLGVTPETLFSYNPHDPFVLHTMALAGTYPKCKEITDLKNDPKEWREHQLVVEGIEQSMQKWGRISIGATEILELPNINHLVTPITVNLSYPICFEQTVKRLHPTAALGTFPKHVGWEWLNQYQKHLNRGRYGAPAGVFFPQKGLVQCLVAIRNVQWNEQGMRIGAGCGIIRESQFSKEWNEINLKINAIQEILAL